MNEQTQLTVVPQEVSIFARPDGFEHAQRVSKMLSESELVPVAYQKKIANTMIALELSQRIGASPLMVMQNLAIIHGKPSFSSTFLIAAMNQSGRFSPIRFEISGEGDQKGCIAWALDHTGERLESPKVTIAMAKAEGWFNKSGSKWQTMPELMMRYRAAAFFSRLYCPEITMGMQSREEVEDIGYTEIDPVINEKKALVIGTPAFDRAVKKLQAGGSIEDIAQQFSVDTETEYALLDAIEPKVAPQAAPQEPTKDPNPAPPVDPNPPQAKPEKAKREWKKPEVEVPLDSLGKNPLED